MNETNTMTILVVEPEKVPYIAEIGTGLEPLQKAVGGYIETVYPYEEPVALIVNEEGKLDGLPLNRALRDADGEIYDVTAGTMLVVGLGEEDFCSLTDAQIKQFSEKFRTPEQFISLNGHLIAIPMETEPPEQEKAAVPVYLYPASYATAHNQLEAYRDSFKLNMACKEAIEEAIRSGYRDNRLNPACVRQVLEEYGPQRVQFVLAATIRHMDWDERYSRDNRAWAKTVPIYDNKDSWGQDRNQAFVITQAHPGLVDLFVNQARKESGEAEKGKVSVREKLQKPAPTPIPSQKKRQVPER